MKVKLKVYRILKINRISPAETKTSALCIHKISRLSTVVLCILFVFFSSFNAAAEQPPSEPNVYQAEDAVVGGGATIDDNHNDFNGSGFVNFPRDGGYVQWTGVDGGSGGTATLSFRYALGKSSPRTVDLTVNGRRQDLTFEPTGGWSDWSNVATTVTLDSGMNNTIWLESTGQDGGNVDEMTISRDMSMCKLYPAEDAVVGGGATIDDNHNDFNGSGFVNFPRDGGYVEWTGVDGGAGVRVTLSFRYALGKSSPRTVDRTVNGLMQDLTFEPTGGWSDWSNVATTVTLDSGMSNTIRLESTGQDGGNVDEMTVCFSAESSIEVEAENMALSNYVVEDNDYASGDQLIKTENDASFSRASFEFNDGMGDYDIEIFYFDENDGQSPFKVFVGDTKVDEWTADGEFNSDSPDNYTLTSRIFCNVPIDKGDSIRIEGKKEDGERARVDRLSIRPHDDDCICGPHDGDCLWNEKMPEIESRIVPPQFGTAECKVTDYKAIPNDGKDDRAAFQDAIVACGQATDGGTVVVPGSAVENVYDIHGPIHLKSNIRLHLEAGAKIIFDDEPENYLVNGPFLTRWEGTRIYNYSPFITAEPIEFQNDNRAATETCKNVAITGKGTLDGQVIGEWKYWRENQKAAQRDMREKNKEGASLTDRQYGEGDYLRPSMIEFYDCENILIEDITILDCPFWCIHPVFSKNVTIRNVTYKYSPKPEDFETKDPWPPYNTDGIDIDSSEYVLIENITFDNGDDNIAIKSGRDREGRDLCRDAQGNIIDPGINEELSCAEDKSLASKNIIIRDSTFKEHNAIAIGSEMSGGVRWVFAENCNSSGNINRGIYLKSNKDRGGSIKEVLFRDIDFGVCKNSAIEMDMSWGTSTGNQPPSFSDVFIKNLTAKQTRDWAIQLEGLSDKPITNVTLQNIDIEDARDGKAVKCEYVNNLVTKGVTVEGIPVKECETIRSQ